MTDLQETEEDRRLQIAEKMKNIIEENSRLMKEKETLEERYKEAQDKITKLQKEIEKERNQSDTKKEDKRVKHLSNVLSAPNLLSDGNSVRGTRSATISDVRIEGDFEESLREACRNGEIEKVRKLLTLSVHLNSKDESGYTALHWSCMNGKLPIVSELIRAGANINIADHGGWTPLHYASFKGHKDIVEALIIQPEIDLEMKNSSKKTPEKVANNKIIASIIKDAKSSSIRSLFGFAKKFWTENQPSNSISLPEVIRRKEVELLERERLVLEKDQEVNRKEGEALLMKQETLKKQKEDEEKRTFLVKKEESLAKLNDEIRLKIEQQGESELKESTRIITMEDLVLLEEIGQGTFGSVHKALWNGDLVAVKVLKAKIEDIDLIRSFQSEADFLSKLHHPNVLMLLAASCRAPNLAIVTELMKGDLMSVLLGKEKLEWKERISMATDIARGMNYLHNMEGTLVHRDLKSGNTLVDEFMRVKISDFGSVVPKRKIGTKLVGTAAWMSPERLIEEETDERTDVFSYGVVLWEILMRKIPWEGLSNIQVVARVGHAGERLTLPEQTPKGCPPSFINLIKDCWETHYSKRPSFKQVLNVLREMKV